MYFKIVLEETNNGVILTIFDHYDYCQKKLGDGGEIIPFKVVYSIDNAVYSIDTNDISDEYNLNNLNNFRDMLYEIINAFGVNNSRYSKEKINVEIVHGDKYVCKEKNCPICKKQKGRR